MARSPSRAADAAGRPAGWRRVVVALAVTALATGSFGVALPARAETLVSWVATGTIDRVDLDLEGAGIEEGETFTARFTFDTDAVDISDTDPTRGDYPDLLTAVEVTVDGGTDGLFTWAWTPETGTTFDESNAVVFDDWLGPSGDDAPRDQWWLETVGGDWAGPTLNDYAVSGNGRQRFLDLFDDHATAFTSDALPTSPPDLAPFESRAFLLFFADVDNFRQAIGGTYETLRVDGQPEPLDVPIGEAVGVTDTVTISVEAAVGISETVGVTDTVRVAVGSDLAVPEAVGVTDTVTVAVEADVGLAERVGVSDTVTVAVAATVPVTETVGVTDTVTIAVQATAPVTEAVGVTDTVTVEVGVSTSDGTLTAPDGTVTTTFHTGDTAQLTGDGFAPGSTVEIELRSDPIDLGSTTADGSGAIDVTVTIPPDAPPGEHTLVGIGVTPTGVPHEVRAELTVLDGAPQVLHVGDPDPVQHSDGLVPVPLTVSDPNSPAGDLEITTSGLPEGVAVSSFECGEVDGTTTCTAALTGTVTAPAGTYDGAVTVADGLQSDTVGVTIVVVPEDGHVALSPADPVSVQVDPDTGTSGPVTLHVRITERDPDEGHEPGPVALDDVGATVTLEPLGRGATVPATCEPDVADDQLRLTCTVDQLDVDTYAVAAVLDGRLLAGADEEVLTVSDPELGFATGGGEIVWPATATPDCDGDRTRFGFTMEHNKKGNHVKGAFLLVRHTCDGGIIRVRSNALDGLAIGGDGDTAWASFSGKATFLAPWLDDVEGNHAFTVYVEDDTIDRFWIEVRDKDGHVIADASLPRPGADHAVMLDEGDVVVPSERPGPRRQGRRAR